MDQDRKFWSFISFLAAICFCVMCFGLYSCQVEDNKLRSKCIESKGTWVGSMGGGEGGCLFK